MTRRRRFATAFRPLPLPAPDLGRRSLVTSVSMLSLAISGLTFAGPLRAQEASPTATLPGTQPLQGGRWVGARLPTVAQGNNGLVMTIKQEQERALLDWQKFDVGATEEVVFDQQQTTWIALNRIFDNKPSEIAGRITAKGQVWLANTNGLIFKGTSQVNTHSILATTTVMPDDVIANLTGGGRIAPGPNRSNLAGLLYGAGGDIVVEQGARLTLKSSDSTVNSKAILLGLNVRTAGTIDVTDGQALLVAGEQFQFATYNETFAYPNLRGIYLWTSPYPPAYGQFSNPAAWEAFMRARAAQLGMKVVNDGTIVSTRGNVFLQGAEVTHNGTILSTTGVRERSGSVILRAAFGFDDSTQIFSSPIDWFAGKVTLGEGSLLQITPEKSTDASPALENFPGSNVTLTGETILMAANSTVRATGGTVDITANYRAYPNTAADFGGTDNGKPGSFTMKAGALIDVSGADNVAFDVADNVVELNVRANELSASPEQRDGVLYGEDVTVDIRRGTSILDWTGTLANRNLTAEQRSVNGGTVNIRALRQVRMDEGSKVDLSGGTALYAGGMVETTLLRTADGRIVDIADADATIEYTGLTRQSHFETGYTEGGDAGALEILAPSYFLYGRVLGDVVNGARQLAAGIGGATPKAPTGATNAVPTTRLARGGEVTIGTGSESLTEYFVDQVYITAGTGSVTRDVDGGQVTLDPTKIDESGYLEGSYSQAMPNGVAITDPRFELAPGWVLFNGAPVELRGKLVELGYAGTQLEALLQPSAALPTGFLRGRAVRFAFVEDAFASGANGIQTLSFLDKGDAGTHRWEIQSGADLRVAAGGTLLVGGTPAFVGTDVTLTAAGGEVSLFAGRIGAGTKLTVAGEWTNDLDAGGRFGGYVDGGRITLQGALIDGNVTLDAAGGGWWRQLSPASATGAGRFELVSGEGGTVDVYRNASQSAVELLGRLNIDVSGLAGFGNLGLWNLGDVVIGPEGGTAPAGAVYLSDRWLNARGVGSLTISTGGLTLPLAGSVGRILTSAIANPNLASTAPDFLIAQAGEIVTPELLARIAAANAAAAAYNATRPAGQPARRIITDALINANLDVAAGTRVDLARAALALDRAASQITSGTDLATVTSRVLLPELERSPANLALVSSGGLRTSVDSEIRVDTLGSITLTGRNQDLAGDLFARAGRIILQSNNNGYGPGGVSPRIIVRPTAFLDARGIAQTQVVQGNTPGHRWIDGRVLAGGTISIATTDELVVEPGALFDVSGASALLTASLPGRFGIVRQDRLMGSDAGAIAISGGEGYMLGDIRGEAGTPQARSGEITLGGGLDGQLFVPTGTTGVYGLQGILTALTTRLIGTTGNGLNSTTLSTNTRNIQFNNLRDWWGAPAQASLRTATGLQAADVEPIPFTRTGNTVTVTGTAGGTYRQATAADIARIVGLFEASFAKMVSNDTAGRFYLDPSLAALPAGMTAESPLPGGPVRAEFVMPASYAPIVSQQAFLNTMTALRQGTASTATPNATTLSTLRQPGNFTVGKGVFDKLSTFESVSLGAISLQSDLTIEAKTRLRVSGDVSTNGSDLTLKAQQISFGSSAALGANVVRPPVAMTDAVMTAVARDISVANATFAGFGTVNLTATHALAGGNINITAAPSRIYAPGDLVITAGQIYPYAATQFSILSDKSITIKGTGEGGSAPLSAAGVLKLQAPTITQGGVLSAPFGTIQFDATDVNFLPGSVTSVSAGDRTILYGYTVDGSAWYGPVVGQTQPQLLNTPPEKRIVVNGDNVNLQAGSIIDASGGGDVLGIEFVQGPLGATNILTGAGVFAISPAFGDDVSFGSAPSSANRADLAVGDTVWLPAFDGHEAGFYTLLPAEYALTPGAYRLTVASSTLAGTGATRTLADGTLVVAGYQTGEQGAAYTAQTYSTFNLLSGAEVRRRSEFLETSGNTFFSSERFLTGLERSGAVFNASPRLPVDGGFMSIAARKTLELNGTFRAAGATAANRGGLLDIASDLIVVASKTTDISDLGAGWLRLDPSQLSNVAESLLIGGVRRQGAGGLEIVTGFESRGTGGAPVGGTIGAEKVVVRNDSGSALTGVEILFTATDQIKFESGSVVRATGDGRSVGDVVLRPELAAATISSVNYAAEDRGAFVRVSNLGDAGIVRTAPKTDRGDIVIETGVRLEATDAVALNATRNTTLAPDAIIKAGAIEAAAGSVSFGNAPASANGLALTQSLFDALAGAGTLRLRSLTDFALYGDVSLVTANDLVLDGGGIRDVDGTGANRFQAKNLTLTNSLGAVLAPTANGASLAVKAETLTRAAGAMGLGFGSVEIDVAGRMLFTGTGATVTPGAVSIRATEVTATGGAAHDLTAGGTLELLSQAQPAQLAALETAGASLDLVGRSVLIDLPLLFNSGVVRATAVDDVTVGAKGLIDVSGSEIDFYEKTEYLTAGGIGLSSENGDVVVAQGAVLDVAGGQGGGDSGSLVFAASRGVAKLDGTLKAGAASGFRGGEFTLQTSTLDNFAALNATLNTSGFSRLRRFSVVDGNAVIEGVTQVERFELSTGTGSVTVAGGAQIVTTGDKGGTILIASGGDLTVNAGALLNASARGADERGGTISLQVGDQGAINVGAATLNVSANGSGQEGEVHLRARQIGNDVAVTAFQANVLGGVTQLEAYRVTDLGTGNGVINTALQTQVTNQAAAFMAAGANAIRTRLGQPDTARFVIAPGIEIRAGGNLTLVDHWNLKTARYGGAAGVLTLRAGGDLNFANANLSDGFQDAVRTQEFYAPLQLNVTTLPTTLPVMPNKLTDDRSWSYNLVAGADFSQTNVLATRVSATGAGDINVDGVIRTGTGDIKLAASGDLNYAQPDAWTFNMTTSGGPGGVPVLTLNGPNGQVFTFNATSGINSNLTYAVNVPNLGLVWWRPGRRDLTLVDGRNLNQSTGTGVTPVAFSINNASIYTAGVTAPAVADFDAANGFSFNAGSGRPEAFYLRPNYTWRGGDIAVTVGGSIIGTDNPHAMYDWAWWRGAIVPGAAQGQPGYNALEQNFSVDAMGFANQTSTGTLFDSFRQSLGALGGGDVAITAGGDARNLGIALPDTLRVSGGRTVGSVKTLNSFASGDLELDIGGALDNSWIYVAKGVSDIRTDGAIGAGAGNVSFVIDDAQLKVQAGGAIRVASVYSGAWAPRGASYRPQAEYIGYTENTSAEFLSLGGDITLFGRGRSAGVIDALTVMPSVTRMVAPNGSVNFGDASVTTALMDQLLFDQYPHGHVEVLARRNISFNTRNPSQGAYSAVIGWDRPEYVGRLLNPVAPDNNAFMTGTTAYEGGLPGQSVGGAGYSTGGGANVRAGRDEFSAFYALEGDIVSTTGQSVQGAQTYNTGVFFWGHETRLKAGDDIRMGRMHFYNQDADDVSMVQAGGSIYLPNIAGYGAGRMWVQAGDEIFMGTTPGAGIRAIEFVDGDVNTQEVNGIDLTVLAGIDQAPEYAKFIDYYLGTENIDGKPGYLSQYFTFDDRNLATPHDTTLADGATEVTIYAIELINYWHELHGRPAISLEGADGRPVARGTLIGKIAKADYDAALEWYQGLDPVKQAPLATRIMFAELKTGGREAVGSSIATDPIYERNGNPTRGYDAIGRLFPGAQRKPGEAKKDGEARWFGDLIMTNSQIRTDGGGDAEILVPGGMVQLASLGITNTDPNRSGVLTQDRGSVYALTYDDYIVNQSRTMTADDGDILIWSSFGDIDAGKGRKTSLAIPPIQFPIDEFAITRVVRSGLPNGAGIATLNRVDGTPGGDVDLYAFNGIVNAGDAGIRASRDLFIGAIEIRGLDNITVGGVTNVDLGTDEGTVGALNLENFAQALEDEALEQAFDMTEEVEKLRTVRQTILTGSVVSFGIEGEQEEDDDE
ncbi:MAG: hypothetical protein B7Z33_10220 [Sphingomonadales bacterium 12-68-11]|nr:MAG: hypothetical protein B7Z33_10220 [Sphingomonadales bacterium 12-68-11]